MRSAFSTFILIILGPLVLALTIVSNLWLVVSSPERVKSLAEESDVYETAAFFIRESVVIDKNLTLADSAVLEDLNETVTAKTVKTVLDGTLDQIYLALENPDKPTFDLNVSLPELKLGETTGFELQHTVSLEGNPAVPFYKYLPLALAGLGLIILIFLGLLFALGQSTAGKLKWLSGAFLYSAILALLFGAFFLYVLPGYTESVISGLNILADPKLINGAKRLLVNLIDSQKSYYYVEVIGLFFIAGILYFCGNLFVKEKNDAIDLNRKSVI